MKLLEKTETTVSSPRRSVKAPSSRARAFAPTTVAPRTGLPEVGLQGRQASIVRRRKALAPLGRLATFAGIAALTYVFSTLSGYVQLEAVRQRLRQGEAQEVYARSEAKLARESIEDLTNPSTLRAWADSHGFLVDPALVKASPSEGHRPSLVAKR